MLFGSVQASYSPGDSDYPLREISAAATVRTYLDQWQVMNYKAGSVIANLNLFAIGRWK